MTADNRLRIIVAARDLKPGHVLTAAGKSDKRIESVVSDHMGRFEGVRIAQEHGGQFISYHPGAECYILKPNV